MGDDVVVRTGRVGAPLMLRRGARPRMASVGAVVVEQRLQPQRKRRFWFSVHRWRRRRRWIKKRSFDNIQKAGLSTLLHLGFPGDPVHVSLDDLSFVSSGQLTAPRPMTALPYGLSVVLPHLRLCPWLSKDSQSPRIALLLDSISLHPLFHEQSLSL